MEHAQNPEVCPVEMIQTHLAPYERMAPTKDSILARRELLGRILSGTLPDEPNSDPGLRQLLERGRCAWGESGKILYFSLWRFPRIHELWAKHPTLEELESWYTFSA